jgi:hypothetical protein
MSLLIVAALAYALLCLFLPRFMVFAKAGPKGGGPNATNNFFTITIWREISCFAGVLAQERFERGFKWIVALAVAAPAALLIGLIVDPVLAPMGLLAGILVTRLRPLLEEMELRGHAIETYVASAYYGFDLAAYEAKEAAALLRGSYRDKGLFKSRSERDVQRLLAARRVAARRWCDRHRSAIAADKAWGEGK